MSEKKFFPMFIDISDKVFLVIGGGKVAARRVKTLVNFGCTIKLIAPEVDDEIINLHYDKIHIIKRKYDITDMDEVDFCLAATDIAERNSKITWDAKLNHIAVNNASDKNDCDFYFPGVGDTAPLTIGICASGVDHKLAKQVTDNIREKIEHMLEGDQKENI